MNNPLIRTIKNIPSPKSETIWALPKKEYPISSVVIEILTLRQKNLTTLYNRIDTLERKGMFLTAPLQY